MTKSKAKKRYAVQRHLDYATSQISSNNINIVDVAKHLSQTNHRLYRQSRVYKTKVSAVTPIDNGREVDVYVLRDTWMLQKAYQMAKDTFDKNTVEERSGLIPSNVARWQDFRIVLNPASGVTYNETQVGISANDTMATTALTAGEFEASLVHKENGTAYTFGFFELANSRWSILKEYDRAGNTNDSPSNPTGGNTESPYSGLDDDNQDASREHLATAGNNPPYDGTSLDPNFLFRKVATIGGSDAGHKMSTGFFDAPLGCIILVASGWNKPLQIEVAAGDYKGVHGETYIDATKKFGHRRA